MSRIAATIDVFPACEKVSALVRRASRRIGPRETGHYHIHYRWADLCRRWSTPVVFISMLSKLDDADVVNHWKALRGPDKKCLVISDWTPCQAIPERLARLDVRNPERIHLIRATTEKEMGHFIGRFLATLGTENEAERILDAWWEGETLVAFSPNFKRLHVPLDRIPPLRLARKEQLSRFEIDEDGEFLYWPELDVHLGWEQLAQTIDHGAFLRAKQVNREFNRRYGKAVRDVRVRRGLLQSEIPGLTARQVGRIESGQCRATVGALTKLANAHNLSVSEYMEHLAKSLAQED